MPVALLMPALSPTMTEGNIAKWIKKVGDEIVSGDIIAEVETDKATMEVEAVDEGKLASIIFPDGSENVPVNKLIGVIALDGDTEADIKQFIISNSDVDNNSENEKVSNIPLDEERTDNASLDEVETDNSLNEEKIDNNKQDTKNLQVHNLQEDKSQKERILISPLAKRIAQIKGLDINKITGTGPKGRIIKRDLEESNFSSIRKDDNILVNEGLHKKIVKLSNIRKTIATKLQEAKSTIPHFYLKGKVQLDSLVNERNKLNNFLIQNNEDFKISYNDYFIKAIALALRRVPSMNSIWNNDGSVTEFSDVDISVAVATDNGLFTPVIKQACSKSLETISKEVREYAVKAKKGKLLPEEYTGGSFSISNLGMYGIEEFTAIINPPQSGIIAIGDIIDDVVVLNNEFKICKTMSFVLSVDHRIVDGATAASLLKYFKFYLSNPSAMLV